MTNTMRNDTGRFFVVEICVCDVQWEASIQRSGEGNGHGEDGLFPLSVPSLRSYLYCNIYRDDCHDNLRFTSDLPFWERPMTCGRSSSL
jgi:hypothetical protein